MEVANFCAAMDTLIDQDGGVYITMFNLDGGHPVRLSEQTQLTGTSR